VKKTRKVKWMENIAHTERKRNPYRLLEWKPKEKTPLER
jgi:hypothetical protein